LGIAAIPLAMGVVAMFIHKRLAILFLIKFFLFFGLVEVFSIEHYSIETVYFIPADSEDRSELLDLDDIMKNIQFVYESEMDRHGFPGKTFRLETSNEGKVVTHIYNGIYNKNHYGGNTYTIVTDELKNNGFNSKKSIYAIIMADMHLLNFGKSSGIASAAPMGGWFNNSDHYGYAIVAERDRVFTERVLMHELGHTFGLSHIVLYDPVNFIMGSGVQLSEHEARWLSKHHYFNKVWNFSLAPKITKFNGAEAFGDENIRFSMNVTDVNGIHQSYAMLNSNFIGWDFLEGNKNETVDITNIDRKLLRGSNQIWIQLMDNDGNWFWYAKTYTLPPTKKIEAINEFDPSKKNTDLNLEDDNDVIDDTIDNCIHCDISDDTDLSDYQQRSVNAKNKLSTSWGKIKSNRY